MMSCSPSMRKPCSLSAMVGNREEETDVFESCSYIQYAISKNVHIEQNETR